MKAAAARKPPIAAARMSDERGKEQSGHEQQSSHAERPGRPACDGHGIEAAHPCRQIRVVQLPVAAPPGEGGDRVFCEPVIAEKLTSRLRMPTREGPPHRIGHECLCEATEQKDEERQQIHGEGCLAEFARH
jgi:hypothetical protein